MINIGTCDIACGDNGNYIIYDIYYSTIAYNFYMWIFKKEKKEERYSFLEVQNAFPLSSLIG